jgi:hypothetical protein
MTEVRWPASSLRVAHGRLPRPDTVTPMICTLVSTLAASVQAGFMPRTVLALENIALHHHWVVAYSSGAGSVEAEGNARAWVRTKAA